MPASALLSIGSRALFASTSALQTTGNNIANANTPGYSRQSLGLQTAGQSYSGGGYQGQGVDVTGVQRAYDAFITREATVTRAAAAADEARSAQLQRLEQVFPLGEQGIGYAAGQMFNSMVDVVNRPTDAAARQALLSRADDLARRFRNAGEQIETLQQGVNQGLKVEVQAANAILSRIAQLNDRVQAYRGFDQAPNNLFDQRDLAISELNQYIQVTTIRQDDGTISLMLGGGQQLLLGNEVNELAVLPNDFGDGTVQIGVADSGTPRALPTGLLVGGSISGMIRFQNQDLERARNQLGQMALAIGMQVNQQQALGLDQGVPPAAGSPLFGVTVRAVAPSGANATSGGVPVASYINGSGVRVPSVSFTISSPRDVQASDYEFMSDGALPAGSYRLTRLSDGKVFTVSPGSVVDGMTINVQSPVPPTGDRFLLQPVNAAAVSMEKVLNDPKGIAAASPVQASLGATNKGTAAISSLNAVSTTLNTNLRANLTFGAAVTLPDGSTGRTVAYDLVDTSLLPPSVTSSGSLTWAPGQALALNGWELTMNGVPASGDTVVVEKTLFPNTSNGNAKALMALRDARIVGQQTVGTTVIPGDTPTDAYANLLAQVGSSVQTAKASAEQSSAVMQQAKAALSEKSGVNLDEEAARLIQYQQSYQAAAKVLQVAQSLFETLLNAAT
jgi:flagellar hook-associated protein 1 FlgK